MWHCKLVPERDAAGRRDFRRNGLSVCGTEKPNRKKVGRTLAAEGGIRKRRRGQGGTTFPTSPRGRAGVGDNTGRALAGNVKVNAGSEAPREE